MTLERILQRLKRARIERNLSQEDLAELMGTSQAYLSRLENGRISPRHTTLERYANAVGVSLNEIADEEKVNGE